MLGMCKLADMLMLVNESVCSLAILPRQNRSMAEVIAAEWGRNEKKEVQKRKYGCVHCKCDKQPPCGMVVKYTLLEQSVRRESKKEHGLSRSLRNTGHEVAEMASNPSQDNPEAADSDMPIRSQVSRRKSIPRVRQNENSIEEVKAPGGWGPVTLAEAWPRA